LRIDFFYHSVISPFAKKLFLLAFSSHCSTQNISFSDSGYVIKPLQPSSALHGASPFTGYQNLPLVDVENAFHKLNRNVSLENIKNFLGTFLMF